MKTLLLLIAFVAAAATAKTLKKRGAPKDFPINACPYGRNDEMECCEASRQYTDDDNNVQQCCIGSYVKCATELLKGQKSVHWSNNDRKKRGAPKDFPTNACPYGRNDEMECCQASRQYTDDDNNVKQCCIGSYVKCAKELLKGQKSVHWSNNDRKKRGAPKDFPTNACPYGRNDEMECCEANREYTDDDGNAQSCCIGSYVKCAKELLKGTKSVHWPNGFPEDA